LAQGGALLAAAMADAKPKTEERDDALTSVEVSALVIMRIVKHCQENLPDPVTGPLLGLDEGATLYATDCFGYPQKLGDDDDDDQGQKYQLEMLRNLRDVNVDCNIIGWYQSTYMGSFLNETLVDTQFMYQSEIPKSVVIVYDPLQLAEGKAFRAFRLQPAFMKKYEANKKALLSGGSIQSMTSGEIFQEVPIHIVNSVMVEAFLFDQSHKMHENQFAALDLENQSYLEKNITFLLDSLDYLGSEQQKIQYYERLAVRQAQQQKTFTEKRKQENAARKERGEELLPEEQVKQRVQMPSQIDTLLLSNQIQTYCSQIQTFAGDSFGKVYLVGGVQ